MLLFLAKEISISFLPVSDGSSSVCPATACCYFGSLIFALLFAIHHRTSARIKGANLKQEKASVTLVKSIISTGARMSTNMAAMHEKRTGILADKMKY